MTALSEEITALCRSLGACDVGFFDTPLELGHGITVAVRLSDAIIDEIDGEPTLTYFNHYRSVNALIDHILLRVGLLLSANGYRYITVAASQSMPNLGKYRGRFSHKMGAVLSGMGHLGRNCLFLHEKYGPRVRLGTVLTDFSAGVKRETTDTDYICASCGRCVSACPAQALYGADFDPGNPDAPLMDYRACSEHMKKAYQHIGRGAVCGICMRVCPKGHESRRYGNK